MEGLNLNDTASESNSLGDIFDRLNTHVAMLHLWWQSYEKLFATNEERFNLIKDQIPGFGGLLHDLLADAVILGICRVTDAAETSGHQSLTIAQLIPTLNPAPNDDQLKWLDKKRKKISTAATTLKQHRNKRIAHNDLSIAADSEHVLPKVSREEISDVLKDIAELMGNLGKWYRQTEIGYDVILTGDADSLIRSLQGANRLRELQNDYHFRRLSHAEILVKVADRNLGAI